MNQPENINIVNIVDIDGFGGSASGIVVNDGTFVCACCGQEFPNKQKISFCHYESETELSWQCLMRGMMWACRSSAPRESSQGSFEYRVEIPGR